MKGITIGFCLCGSYCTFDSALTALADIRKHDSVSVMPIMSESAYTTDSRFGTAREFIDRIELMCGTGVINSVTQAEPIGPKALLDILVIAPCTGNTLAKIANGITDTVVTMAAKAHLRNNRPLVIAISSNDALSANAANLGALLARKNVFFVPFYQDDPEGKPTSLISDLSLLPGTINAALDGRQLQPLLTRA
ncbi:MAG: dipicolinate synthase subunit B [Oscillospiraceae bacterium]|nr:dipicolinate synthase subunit B [Oscillospiraceae bacterium]